MPPKTAPALQAVGIDLGTTYSCLSYLTPQGQPVGCPNSEGELSTPSVVLFEGDEIVVGTEAQRNAVAQPERVVQHAKRFMGDPRKNWVIDGQSYSPVDISSFIIRKLLDGAEERLGVTIRHAVVTVPAQFSDFQRQRTIEAGTKAGLERVDVINEPVAAALCYVLGEGMWFAELADDQTVMVFDLGGGTFDLSLVRYNKDQVTVVATGGDLRLGGLDWNQALSNWACEQFVRESPENDPRLDRQSMQALSIDVEQAKRALSVRPRAAIVMQHGGRRKTFAIDRAQFEKLTQSLVEKARLITEQMLREHKLKTEGRGAASSKHAGWAHVNAVLVTGGASRMPMIRSMLQSFSGATLNSTLSPDQSIAHGAAYYCGMLLSGEKLTASVLNQEATARLARFKQQSVSARSLGILVRDPVTGRRQPYDLIPPNTPLPVSARQNFGTVSANQHRVSLRIIEGAATPGDPHVDLGECQIDGLPPNLPAMTPIEVTIHYDEQARVHVTAREPQSGLAARTTIIREENLRTLPREAGAASESPPLPPPQAAASQSTPQRELAPRKSVQRKSATPQAHAAKEPPAAPPAPAPRGPSTFVPADSGRKAGAPMTTPPRAASLKRERSPAPIEEADRPILLCNACGEPIDSRGRCVACGEVLARGGKPAGAQQPASPASKSSKPSNSSQRPAGAAQRPSHTQRPPGAKGRPGASGRPGATPSGRPARPAAESDAGEEEFWRMLGEDPPS
ncbi:MAG: Hsp70 family protein [Planctomyces sp.]|nr:Hsp70 family protein [Planctomyces sp.]